MTFGTKYEGTVDSAFYRMKNWSGGDGKYDANGRLNWHAYTLSAQTMYKVKSVPWLPYFPNGLWPGGTGEGAHLDVFNANDELKLFSKLASEVRGHSFNLGVTAAELPQSLRLVALNLNRISQALNAVKHGRIDHAVRVLGAQPAKTYYSDQLSKNGKRRFLGGPRKLVSKDISAMWLEIQYGWMPAVKDIYEAMAAFSAVMDLPRTSQITVTTNRTLRSEYITGGSLLRNFKKTKVSGRIVYEMTEALPLARSLGLTNPAAILWEKMPWSFIFDWALPIGSYLDALNVIPQLNGRFCYTQKRVTTCRTEGTNRQYQGARINSTAIHMVRTIPTSLSVPFPVFKPLNKILSPGHVLNALALMHQVARDPRVPVY